MARIKFYYDTETCRYERVTITFKEAALNFMGFLAISGLCGLASMFLYLHYFDSPKEVRLKQENEELHQYYAILNNDLKELNAVVEHLKEKDHNVYRLIFETKPLEFKSSIKNNDSEINHYKKIVEDRDGSIKEVIEKINHIKKSLSQTNASYDQLLELAHRKEVMLSSIPAIQPVSNKHLKMLVSGFGMRIHPIYKVKKMHTGIDFAAPRGTPIYSTGDGIAYVPGRNDGYGQCVEVDHGYGFQTRYAHMDKIKIKNGQHVKRGEIIGFVGSSGTATSAHLHYEVIKNGEFVDPIHYFFNDLSPEEFEEMIKISSIENQSLG